MMGEEVESDGVGMRCVVTVVLWLCYAGEVFDGAQKLWDVCVLLWCCVERQYLWLWSW